jgi:hypothetical protein
MKIYFTASARGKDKYLEYYKKIYESIEELGHENLDKLLFEINTEEFYSGNEKKQKDLYKNTLIKIRKADVIVLEVSVQSLSMGYIIDKALENCKPVILLYKEKVDVNPYFVGGIQDEKLQVYDYNLNNLKDLLRNALDDANEQMDVRFNFFVSPKIVQYLDWISKFRKMPRAVYLRRLIEKEMEKNKEYKRNENESSL